MIGMRLPGIALCFAFVIGLVLAACTFFNQLGHSGRSTPAQENVQAVQRAGAVPAAAASDRFVGEESVMELIERALAADDFLNADSKDGLRVILGQTYAGPLLDELTDAVWETRNTDNCGGARVAEWLEINVDGGTASVKARVETLDWASGQYDQGTASFALAYAAGGWRIVQVDYCWAEDESAAPAILPDML